MITSSVPLRPLLAMGDVNPEWTGVQQLLAVGFSAGYAAIALWLIIRFVNRREHWARWSLITWIVMPVSYVASFGPACWVVGGDESFDSKLSELYTPIGFLSWKSPAMKAFFSAYGRWGCPSEAQVMCPAAEDFYVQIAP
ncbi:MAG: hypothetical protein JSS02_29750 [Planctomycetes bacterium]|nr:hypothetical protein [Planctomycetota bacterium]